MASRIEDKELFNGATVAEIELSISSQTFRDDEELRTIGKKPVLKRPFGFFTMLGLICTIMVTWEGELIILAVNLMNGGLAGSVYGYLYVWLGVSASVVTMAELASMAPTAGGQYHWVAILAPENSRVFLSYVVGWLTTIGWQAALTAGMFLASQMVAGLGVLGNENYMPQQWHFVLMFWAILLFAVAFNITGNWLLSRMEACTLVIHIAGFIAIMIVLAYCPSSYVSATDVFTSFSNGGMFPTEGLSFMVGSLGPAFAILGADGPVHLSEEISNSSRNVPRTIIFGSVLNGIMGFGMLLVCLFGIGDLETVLTSPTGFPFMAIFEETVGSRGALAMSSVVVIMGICACINFVATASRMMWSFARDNGLPGSRWLKQVEPRTSLPLYAIAVTCVTSVCLSFIILGSSVAMNDVVSLSITALYASYIVGNSFLLYRRVKGQIYPYESAADGALRNTAGCERLTWGPWRVPEPWGTIVNAVGVAYMLIMFFFSFWPVLMDPTPAQMNWSSVMIGGAFVFSVLYYFVRGHRFFKGPIVEIDLS